MSDMTVQEFADKLVTDKTFRKEVISHSYDVDPPEGDKDALFIWLNVGARRMGYDFDETEAKKAISARFNKLSGFKKVTFIGSIISKTSKAKKAAGAGR